MSKKKVGGAITQHRGRPGKRLGIKIYGGSKIKTGQIICTQRGTKYHPGKSVGLGRDFTLFSLKDGTVEFRQHLGKKMVSVL